jgi:hypothetical protein
MTHGFASINLFKKLMPNQGSHKKKQASSTTIYNFNAKDESP